jgi:hypothetical protein
MAKMAKIETVASWFSDDYGKWDKGAINSQVERLLQPGLRRRWLQSLFCGLWSWV